MGDCPSIEQLEILAGGEPGGGESDAVRAHLETCPACRRRFDACIAHRALANKLRDAVLAPKGGKPAAQPENADAGEGVALLLPAIPGYQLQREVYRGGQGVVYEAVQEGTHRRVAVKIMIGGAFAGTASRRRFEREVELAAGLRHPNIVAIHDSGVASGAHYFVMDFVDGQRLDHYVWGPRPTALPTTAQRGVTPPLPIARPRRRQSLPDTLRLFATLCEAVNYAHQRGVIHRDLKPSNILVDADGQPRVLDFGLAKQVGAPESLAAQTMVSMEGQVLGTLAYMSPEQARGQSADVDIRSDVYSLGVILYELLTGQFPYVVDGSVAGVLGNVAGAEPRRPSSIDRTIGDEVETIVLKALAKDRERRYQTAGELGRDITRYLTGEAIEAKRDSALYVLKKTLRRYRVPLGVALAFSAVLLAALATSLNALTRTEKERSRAEAMAAQSRLTLYTHLIAGAYAAHQDHQMARMKEQLYECPPDLRGWEWYFLHGLSDQSSWTYRGHMARVWTLALTRRGDRAVSASYDGTLRLWDVATGAQLHRTGISAGDVRFVTFDLDDTRIIAGGVGGPAGCWDAESLTPLTSPLDHAEVGTCCVCAGDWWVTGCPDGTIRRRDRVSGTVQGIWSGQEDLNCLAATPDGRKIAWGSATGNLFIWDSATEEVLRVGAAHLGGCRCLAFSSDGRRIASGGDDCTVRVRDAADGVELARFEGHERRVSAVTFSHDGTLLAFGSDDRTLRLWDTSSNRSVKVLAGHNDTINSVVFGPSDEWLLTAAFDNTLKLWDVGTPDHPPSLPHEGRRPLAATFERPDCGDGGRVLSLADTGELTTWDPRTGRVAHATLGPTATAAAFSPDARLMAVGTFEGQVTIYTVRGRIPIVSFNTNAGKIAVLAFDRGGTMVAVGGEEGQVWTCNPRTGDYLGPLAGCKSRVLCLAFGSDGRTLFAGSKDEKAAVIVSQDNGSVKAWDVTTGAPIAGLVGHEQPVRCIALSRDGQRIATAGEDCTIKVWGAQTRNLLLTIRGHEFDVLSVAFSPRGDRIVSGSWRGMLTLWDATNGVEQVTWPGHHQDSGVWKATFSADGRRILTDGDGTLRVWEASSADRVESDPEAAFHLRRAGATLRDHGQAREADARVQEAAEIYQRAIDRFPDRAEALTILLADLYNECGQPDQAATWRARLPAAQCSGRPPSRP